MTITGERAAATGERVAATGEREIATGEREIASGERPAAMSDASAEVGSAFKGLMAAVRRLRGRETRSHCGLSDAQYGLLLGLREHDQLSSRELAGLANLSPATTTEMLDGLAQAGLVTRVRSEQDRRVVLTSLTGRGQALLEERHAQYAPRWNAAVERFSDDELLTAARVLESLRGMFDEIAREP